MNQGTLKQLQGYAYCPRCGGKIMSYPEGHSYCASCDHITYINVSTAVGCYLYDDSGSILLAQRASDPWKGKYDDPGGFMDRQDASCEETLIREIHEELAIDISEKTLTYLDSIRMLYHYKGRDVPVCAIHYMVYCDSSTKQSLRIQDDVSNVQRVNEKNFDPYMLAVPVQVESVRRAFDFLAKIQ